MKWGGAVVFLFVATILLWLVGFHFEGISVLIVFLFTLVGFFFGWILDLYQEFDKNRSVFCRVVRLYVTQRMINLPLEEEAWEIYRLKNIDPRGHYYRMKCWYELYDFYLEVVQSQSSGRLTLRSRNVAEFLPPQGQMIIEKTVSVVGEEFYGR